MSVRLSDDARVRDDGSVLVAVLGIMLVFTLMAVAAYTTADSSLFASEREKNSMQALHAAEAGMDTAQWAIRALGNQVDSSMTVPVEGGEASVSVIPVNSYQYKVMSTGSTFKNRRATRTLTSKVFYVSLWNFVMGAGSLAAGGGGALVGNTSVNGPFYIRGDLPLSGATNIQGGPLFVKKGSITITGAARVGQQGSPPGSGWIDVFVDGTHPVPGTGRFFANIDQSVPDLQLPPLTQTKMENNYAEAKDESVDGYKGKPTLGLQSPMEQAGIYPDSPNHLVQGGAHYYKVIDNDGVVNGTSGLTLSATTTSFGDPSLGPDFAWVKPGSSASGKGELHVLGTVFVDGPLTISTDVRYRGNGTIVCNGNITVNNELLPLGVYPTEDALGLTTPDIINTTVNSGNNPNPGYSDADIAGAWYAGQEMRFQNNIVVRGSILTNVLTFTGNNNHVLTDPQLPAHLPPSMPGGTERIVFPTRWHEGLN